MIPAPVVDFFSAHQDLLWLTTLVLDLSLTLLMYRLFGRVGLIAAIVLAILLANLQGPKLTVILGMETSLGSGGTSFQTCSASSSSTSP